MRRNSLIFLPLLSFLLYGDNLFAQGGTEPERPSDTEIEVQPVAHSTWQFGIFAGGGLAANSAEFVTLPGVISCQGDSVLYTGVSGGGLQFAGVIGMEPAPDQGFISHLGWSLKAGLSTTSSSFETEERIGQSISPTGELSEIISRYSIDAGLTTLVLEPTLLYQLSESTPLIIGVGPAAGFLIGGTYDQKEEIASPSGAQYADGRTERNVRSGEIEETKGLNLGATLSLAYDISITPVISFRPEISGTLGLTKPVTDVSWKQHMFRGGISLLFNPSAKYSSPLGPGVVQ